MKLFVNDREIDLAVMDIEDFDLELNMQNGVLTRTFIVTIDHTKIRFTFERFLSVVKKELAVIRLTAECLIGEAELKVVSKLDNNVQTKTVTMKKCFGWKKDADTKKISAF